jgi:protein-L-isoaspartate(D-aspartate) O-methyltransferase
MRLALLVALACIGLGASCRQRESKTPGEYDHLRALMVEEQIVSRGVSDQRVIGAMRKVERHHFVPDAYRNVAYADTPLPIGEDQTISQPYIVALMSEELELEPTDRVLEVGTGSGYQAAILGEIVGEVYTIEIVESLGLRAQELLKTLGYSNVKVRIGDGYEGWPERAPFDKIIVTCAPTEIPQPLVEQLREGGLMVIPVGDAGSQYLYRVRKREGGVETEEVIPVRFVPLTGPHAK